VNWEGTEDARQIGRELLRTLDSLTAKVTGQLTDSVPDLPGDAMSEPLQASVRGALEVSALLLVRREPVDRASPAPEMSGFARLTARRGVPLSTLVMLYHRSHNIVEQSLLTIVSSLFGDRPAPVLLETLTGMREWSNRFILQMQEQVADIYRDEIERLHTPGDAGRLALVQSVLDGADSPPDIDGHRLDGVHVAVVLWAPDVPGNGAAGLDAVGRRFARALGSATPPLLVFPSATEAWIWCSPGDAPARNPGTTSAAADLPDGLAATVGPLTRGSAGFAVSHRQAVAYQRLHQLVGAAPAVWSADEAGLTAAAAFTPRLEAARDIVTVALGDLATDDEYSSVLRETARSFLRRGTAGAAGEMIAHRNTVTYRLNKFRETLGEDVLASPDVCLALELTHWFGPLVLRN
jgi:hypothetical protein